MGHAAPGGDSSASAWKAWHAGNSGNAATGAAWTAESGGCAAATSAQSAAGPEEAQRILRQAEGYFQIAELAATNWLVKVFRREDDLAIPILPGKSSGRFIPGAYAVLCRISNTVLRLIRDHPFTKSGPM